MFGLLENLAKATVGVVIETPLSLAADVVTLGGVLTDQEKPYTAQSASRVMSNLEKATNPDA